MKASELRMGNIICSNRVVAQVSRVFFTDTNGESTLLRDAIPDLLTEEWLIRHGCEEKIHKNGNTYKLLINYSSGFEDFIELTNKGGTEEPIFLGRLTTNYQKHFVLPKQVKYVHKFQNLFFELTEKELEIK